jgi:hypothetical protein
MSLLLVDNLTVEEAGEIVDALVFMGATVHGFKKDVATGRFVLRVDSPEEMEAM